MHPSCFVKVNLNTPFLQSLVLVNCVKTGVCTWGSEDAEPNGDKTKTLSRRRWWV